MADGPLSILTGNCPGSTADQPMALVYPGSNETPEALIDMAPEFSRFTHQIMGKRDCCELYIVKDYHQP
jgi:hypothetical protein